MRIFLRILSIYIAVATFVQIIIIWRIWRADAFGELFGTVLLGWITVIAWSVTVTFGPLAVVQLWRLRESGRKSALFLAGFAFAYYAAGALFFRQPEVPPARILIQTIPSIFIVALLSTGPVRRAFSK